jgi:tetratricopeptide (TPR) repeat protein
LIPLNQPQHSNPVDGSTTNHAAIGSANQRGNREPGSDCEITGSRMNRKERRAAAKRRGPALSNDTQSVPNGGAADLMAEANRHYKQGQLVQAQNLCRRLLASDPANFNGLNLLGVIAQASGDHKLAVKMFAKAIAADRQNAACHYNIANSYQALDRRTEAISHFKSAIAFGMNDKSIEG